MHQGVCVPATSVSVRLLENREEKENVDKMLITAVFVLSIISHDGNNGDNSVCVCV